MERNNTKFKSLQTIKEEREKAETKGSTSNENLLKKRNFKYSPQELQALLAREHKRLISSLYKRHVDSDKFRALNLKYSHKWLQEGGEGHYRSIGRVIEVEEVKTLVKNLQKERDKFQKKLKNGDQINQAQERPGRLYSREIRPKNFKSDVSKKISLNVDIQSVSGTGADRGKYSSKILIVNQEQNKFEFVDKLRTKISNKVDFMLFGKLKFFKLFTTIDFPDQEAPLALKSLSDGFKRTAFKLQLCSDTLIACSDLNNYLVVKGKLGFKIYKKRDKVYNFEFVENNSKRVLDALHACKTKAGSDFYYFMTTLHIFEVEVPSDEQEPRVMSLQFEDQKLREEEGLFWQHEKQWFGRMRYCDKIKALFYLQREPGRKELYIQVLELFGLRKQVKIRDRYTESLGFIWFDFINDDSSKILALTPNHQYSVIYYNHLEGEYSLSEFKWIPNENTGRIKTLGPFCLSSSGVFLLICLDSCSDILYRLNKNEKNGIFELENLGCLKSSNRSQHRVQYDNYMSSDNFAQFVVAEGHILKVIGWNFIDERLELISHPVAVESSDDRSNLEINFGNIARVDNNNYFLCDRLGMLTQIQVSE